MRSRTFVNSVKRCVVPLAFSLALTTNSHAQEPLRSTETFSVRAGGTYLPKTKIGEQLNGDMTRKETTTGLSGQLRLSDTWVLKTTGFFTDSTDHFFTLEQHTGDLDRTLIAGNLGIAYQALIGNKLTLEGTLSAGMVRETLNPSFDGVSFDTASANMPYGNATLTLRAGDVVLISASIPTDSRVPGTFDMILTQNEINLAPTEFSVRFTHNKRIMGYDISATEGEVPLPLSMISEDRLSAYILWQVINRRLNAGLVAHTHFFGPGMLGGPDLDSESSRGADARYGPLVRWATSGFEITGGLPVKVEDSKMDVGGFVSIRYEGNSVQASVEGMIPHASYAQPYAGYVEYRPTSEPKEEKEGAEKPPKNEKPPERKLTAEEIAQGAAIAEDSFSRGVNAKTREEALGWYAKAATYYSNIRKSEGKINAINMFKRTLSLLDAPENEFNDTLAKLVSKTPEEASIAIDLRWPTEDSRKAWKIISSNGDWKIRQIPNTKIFVAEVKEDKVWITKPLSLTVVRETIANPSNPKGYTKGVSTYQRAVLNILAQNDPTILVATYEGSKFYIPKEMLQNDAFLIALLGNAGMDKIKYKQLRENVGKN